MRVFLSWSGERSRAIAEVLKGWLPSVLQAVKPYFSPEDTAKGSRWSAEIAKELEASRVALFIVTPENQQAPWLLFEAGALSKDVDRAKVCPLLFAGMTPTDLKGPLVQFQAAQFSEEEMMQVLKSVNRELGESALAPDVLDKVFEMWWPVLEAEVEKQIASISVDTGAGRRSERDLLEEVLAISRNLNSREGGRSTRPIARMAIEDLLEGCTELARFAAVFESGPPIEDAVVRVLRALTYLIDDRGLIGRKHKMKSGAEVGAVLDELDLLKAQVSERPDIDPKEIEDEITDVSEP